MKKNHDEQIQNFNQERKEFHLKMNDEIKKMR